MILFFLRLSTDSYGGNNGSESQQQMVFEIVLPTISNDYNDRIIYEQKVGCKRKTTNVNLSPILPNGSVFFFQVPHLTAKYYLNLRRR
jgi:hypothetical protein